MTEAGLAVRNLRTHFFTKEGVARAVDGVDFDVAPGEILGLVGESGSGKTVTGFSILGLIDPPGRIVEGSSIRFAGEELTTARPERLRAIRGAEIAMIFQDPMMTLNPVLRIDTQMIEAMGLRRDDVYICNVIKCRPPENRTPEKDEIATCSPFLLRQLAVIAPRVVVCLGNVAAQTLLGTHKSISSFRGQWFDFRGSRLLATYHPAYLLRNPAAKGEVWKDLQKVMTALGLRPKKR